MPPLSINIICNKSNPFGISDDIIVIERIIKELQTSIKQTTFKPRVLDVREPHTHCDIQFHLEVPIYSAIPWAHTNVLLVNSEQWSEAYDDYIHAFDALIFRDIVSATTFRKVFLKKGIPTNTIHVIPWSSSLQLEHINSLEIEMDLQERMNEFICLIGGSSNKYNYILSVLPVWTVNDPKLTIYTSREDFTEYILSLINSLNLTNITVVCTELSVQERNRILVTYRGHVICSQSESFGYSASNAEICGAFAIMNAIPIFDYTYTENSKDYGIGWLSNSFTDKGRYSIALPTEHLRDELDTAFYAFNNLNDSSLMFVRKNIAKLRFSTTCEYFLPILKELQMIVHTKQKTALQKKIQFPPVLELDNCPPISVITPTYNRVHLIDIAIYNMVKTDYPHNKIEWIIIEDFDESTKDTDGCQHKLGTLLLSCPDIKIKYIPYRDGRLSIGKKRNIAIEHASSSIIVFMDDDDHYPETSFRRRVAWLLYGKIRGISPSIVCCTTLPLYDLVHCTHAMSVPPYTIPLSQRVSEATLAFYKSVWMINPFPDVSISEGEKWIKGYESDVLEIMPYQIIIAFSHGSNQSNRMIPRNGTPSYFWGFSKEYLTFIHGLVGVQIE
jgi:hypothetical protein